MNPSHLTRGHGLFENFLARQRTRKANRLILPAQRAGRVLDIGCGVVPYFLLHTDFAEKFGLDPAAETVPEGCSITLQREAIKPNQRLPYPDSYFDVVTMLGVLEHFSPGELSSLLKEIHRILKHKGRFILTTPHHKCSPLLKILSKLSLISSLEIKDIQASYSCGGIADVLTTAGFEAKNVSCGYFQAGLNTFVCADK